MMLSSKGQTRALTAMFGGIVTMLSAAVASAQTQPETPAPPAAPAPEPAPDASGSVSIGGTATTDATATTSAEMPPPPAAEPIVEAPAVAPVEPIPVADPAAAEAGEAAPAPAPKLFVFGDVWAGFQSAKSGSASGGDVYATKGPDGSAQSGFGLSWLGADLAYDAGAWAVNGSLRFGDAVAQYGTGTLGPVTQAFLTWRPADGLSLAAGTFGTIYGAEVAESWLNLNYTRGELYMNMQPFWHTGLRAEYAVDSFVARALVVNEPNNSTLNNGAINVGGQLGYVSDVFSAYGGLLQSLAPETSANYGSIFATFIDVVAVANVGDLTLIGNFDYNVGSDTVASFGGGSLAVGYALTPQFGLAARGEYLTWEAAEEGADDPTLLTGTLTFDVKPVKDTDNFVVRLDGRVEQASDPIYNKAGGSLSDPEPELSETWFAATLGIVGYADLL